VHRRKGIIFYHIMKKIRICFINTERVRSVHKKKNRENMSGEDRAKGGGGETSAAHLGEELGVVSRTVPLWGKGD